MANPLPQLEQIDVIQRLGVDYHFSNEIKNILDHVYNNKDTFKRERNLHAAALEFRLLRAHGYHVFADVFDGFRDGKQNFKESLSVDIMGILSLYEASFYLMDNEIILNQARNFSSKYLKEFLHKSKDTEFSLLVRHALEIPLHWRMPRLEASWFIDVYGRRKSISHSLLKLAKLDFNIVQAIHQEDLKHLSSWWTTVALEEKLSFARDRLVENFLWTVGLAFQSQFGHFRRVMTKVNALITLIDDIYDVYGTLEELELFTNVVDRWDVNAMDTLPEYMKICFIQLYNFLNEVACEEKGHQILP
ncbi:hypothetical protein L6164_016780 [Bauhinia variegata]|uniref:Uncharacterized protein n=1 Tax=Bauhinia variegata TaxID=167791 RepID=A0ACB9N7Q5_BAUVA|nr:hypothetical protein L6164_016780 [Bauhinia variegata]